MTKNFRSVKATLIMSIFLFSLFAAMAPATSAADGNLLGLNHIVNLDWATTSGPPIVPYQATASYTLKIDYGVNKGKVFGTLIYGLLIGKAVDIKLKIINPPDWATITMSTDSLTVNIPEKTGTDGMISFEKTISITVTNKAPALAEAQLNIQVNVPAVGPIPALEKVVTLPFKAAYLGKIYAATQKQDIVIGPMDTAISIPIQVTNEGNAQTQGNFEIKDVPAGWSALVTDHIVLDTGEAGTVYLTITPPQGFGYHDDKFTFTIEYTPVCYNDPTQIGETQQLTIGVQSRGISAIGIEVIIPIIILIIVVLFIAYIFIKRMLRK